MLQLSTRLWRASTLGDPGARLLQHCMPVTAVSPYCPCARTSRWDVPVDVSIVDCGGHPSGVRGHPTGCFSCCVHRLASTGRTTEAWVRAENLQTGTSTLDCRSFAATALICHLLRGMIGAELGEGTCRQMTKRNISKPSFAHPWLSACISQSPLYSSFT
jgi:hypothetical protein